METDQANLPLEGNDIKIILFSAIALPDYARVDYFWQQQRKSGWEKFTFFRALFKLHAHLHEKLNILNHVQSGKLYTQVKKGEISEEQRKNTPPPDIDIAKETGGVLSGVFNLEIWIDLEHALETAWERDIPKPVLNSFEILALNERALLFIKDQFNKQIRNIHPQGFGMGPDNINDPNSIAERIDTVYHFSVLANGPFLDYHRYRNEIRKLLLDSTNPEKLEIMTKASRNIAIEIIDIWNNHLHAVEHGSRDENHKLTREETTIEVDVTDLTVSHVTDIPHNKHRLGHGKHYWNYDLAKYASNVANLIGGEIMRSPAADVKLTGASFIRDTNSMILKIRDRLSLSVVGEQSAPIQQCLDHIAEGTYTILTLRSLIPSVEYIVRQILISKGKLESDDESKTLNPMINILRGLRGDDIILSSNTLHLLDMMNRNTILHGNATPTGSALEGILLMVLNALSEMLEEVNR